MEPKDKKLYLIINNKNESIEKHGKEINILESYINEIDELINYHKGPLFIKSAELVFSKVCSLDRIKDFSNIVDLKIIGSPLKSLKGIECLIQLNILHLIDCNMIQIDPGFLKLNQLKELYLQENKIEAIKYLEKCVEIHTFWIFSNVLQNLCGVEFLINLKRINFASNKISKLDPLGNLLHLEEIESSDNPITNFHDIESINFLPQLKSLSFTSCHFEPCPIYSITGYRKFILSSIKSSCFQILDERRIGKDEIVKINQDFTETINKMNKQIENLENNQTSVVI